SSSYQSPALLPSALDTLELTNNPAIPAHKPQKTYTNISTITERIPDRRLASGLQPTASINNPSALLRVNNNAMASIRATTNTETGKAAKAPVPIKAYLGLLTVIICPLVMSCAIPLPATIRISVAIIG